MFKKFISFLYHKYCTVDKKMLENVLKNEIISANLKANIDIHNSSRYYELSQFVGKRIIVVSNNDEPAFIAEAVGIETITQANNPVLLIKKEDDGEIFVCMSKVFVFNEETWLMISLMEFPVRYQLFYNNTHTF